MYAMQMIKLKYMPGMPTMSNDFSNEMYGEYDTAPSMKHGYIPKIHLLLHPIHTHAKAQL